MRRWVGMGIIVVVLCLAAGGWLWQGRLPMTGGPMMQQAYVWQRQWDEPVREAVAGHGAAFDRLLVLAAEIEFGPGRPRVITVPLNHDTLREADHPVGIALRIGPHAGPFQPSDEVAVTLVSLAREQVAAMREQGIEPADVQRTY